MAVQWFPGHMAKAVKEIAAKIDKADIVLEILDARIPFSSRNPILEKIVGKKPIVVVFNKADLADSVVLDKWQAHFAAANVGKKIELIAVSAATGKNISAIINKCRSLCADFEWFENRPIRIMIAGVPNVGKSAILNALAGKKKQEVKNIPGVTRELKKINVSEKIQITDTPGILWHKFEDPHAGEKLAILGSVKDAVLYRDDIALKAIEIMKQYYPQQIAARYKLELEQIKTDTPDELMELIGKKRGCLAAKGVVDSDKVSRIILTDIREGRLGKVCLEVPAADTVEPN